MKERKMESAREERKSRHLFEFSSGDNKEKRERTRRRKR
jgi:hypothetical protein